MPLRTRRWNEPREPGDGLRLLVCRYRPRGVKKADESWELWWPDLGPSAALLAAFHGKSAPPLSWEEYTARYLAEMRAQRAKIDSLARQLDEGATVTLLCSSACTDPGHCHRTLLARLIEQARAGGPSPRAGGSSS
jgi:uncharacterized protein YeaO (DUF488 family)